MKRYIISSISFTTILAALHVRVWTLELVTTQLPLLYLLVLLVTVVSTLPSLIRRKPIRHRKIAILTSALALAVPLHGFTLQSPAPLAANASGDTIRYATYNKLYTNQNSADALTFLNNNNVDIMSLQEFTQAEVDYYKTQLGFTHSIVSTGGKSAYGTEIALISRFPILETRSILNVNIGGVLRSIVDIPGVGQTAVYTAHIRPPVSNEGYIEGLASIQSLAGTLTNEQLPTLLAGDFNTTVFSPRLRIIQDHLQLATSSRNPKCSWSQPVAFTSICMRIDHIFYSSQFQLVSTVVGPDTGSDHRIVLSTLIL